MYVDHRMIARAECEPLPHGPPEAIGLRRDFVKTRGEEG